jgi:hypothetical protein
MSVSSGLVSACTSMVWTSPWGQVHNTGMAIVDDDGELIEISLRRTDEDIIETIAPFVQSGCVVAIDARLHPVARPIRA